MLVVPERKALLLNLRDPGQVLSLIPEGRHGPVLGRPVTVLPHKHEVVQVLRNIGIKAPSPMSFYYDWPCYYPDGPFAHQKETGAFLGLQRRGYCLNGMGSGKTASVLWAFDYLRRAGLVDWLFVVSPLSTLERAWADEVYRNFSDMTCAVVHGTADKRMKLMMGDYDVYVINHDGIKDKKLLAAIRAKPGRGLFVVDELGEFRNAGTDRWKALNFLLNGAKKKVRGVEHVIAPPVEWAWGLTGTPMPKAASDAWAQAKLITPWRVPPYFTAFRDQVMNKITQYKYVNRADALQQVHAVMQPAIRFAREDCIDLPPTIRSTREVPLTTEQKRLYKEMVSRLKTEFAGGQIKAANEAIKRNKLLQIVLGVAYDGQGNEVVIPAVPRMEECLRVIEESASKTIVFVPLTGALNQLAEYLGQHYKVAVVQGATPKAQRDDIFYRFQSTDDVDVLVAQPGCMAHGLSFTAASTTIWFGPIDSANIYQQANERTPRPGQKLQTHIVHLQGSPVERAMYAKLAKREDAQNILLDLFRTDNLQPSL